MNKHKAIPQGYMTVGEVASKCFCKDLIKNTEERGAVYQMIVALIRCPLFQIILINQSLFSGYEKSSQS